MGRSRKGDRGDLGFFIPLLLFGVVLYSSRFSEIVPLYLGDGFSFVKDFDIFLSGWVLVTRTIEGSPHWLTHK